MYVLQKLKAHDDRHSYHVQTQPHLVDKPFVLKALHGTVIVRTKVTTTRAQYVP